MGDIEDLKINRLGARGDGIVDDNGKTLYVPYALAGERVRISRGSDQRAELIDVLEPSENRVAPVCRHFGVCGGCRLQHLATATYLEWKRDIVVGAFKARGITAEVNAVQSVTLGARRRVVLAARLVRDGVLLGFHEEGESTLVDISECPVMRPELVARFAGFRRLVEPLLSRQSETRLQVLSAGNGIAVDLTGVERKPKADLRGWLAREAGSLGIIRLTIDGEPVLADGLPRVRFGNADVEPPAGAFLQACGEAEAMMVETIMAAIPKKAKQAADLFCGLGAFTFPLAARVKVTAIDSDGPSIAALVEADKNTQGTKAIATRVRDLISEPLSRKELEGVDIVVFDPPRAGAKKQAEMLAKSKVPVIVAVSCNPATLARDARILIDGGYVMDAVQPIDQFVYSPHVEAVAVFRRGKSK